MESPLNIQILLHNIGRIVFVGGSATMALAFIEGIAQLFDVSLIGSMYPSGRLVELAAGLLVFVIAVLLREIRDELRTNGS